MSDTIKFEFTKEQFRTMLDIVYAGNYLLTATNEEDEEKYNKLESLFFSRVDEIGKKKYAEYDSDYGGWLPSEEFLEQGIDKRVSEYDNAVFWDDLAHRLALKDVAASVKTDNPDILIEALLDRTDEYQEYLDEKGMNVITVDGMKPMDKNIQTFRSMDVGEIESYGVEGEDDESDTEKDDEK